MENNLVLLLVWSRAAGDNFVSSDNIIYGKRTLRPEMVSGYVTNYILGLRSNTKKIRKSVSLGSTYN